MRTKVASFFIFFQELSNKKKIKAPRPKMTKIASRGGGSCLKQIFIRVKTEGKPLKTTEKSSVVCVCVRFHATGAVTSYKPGRQLHEIVLMFRAMDQVSITSMENVAINCDVLQKRKSSASVCVPDDY